MAWSLLANATESGCENDKYVMRLSYWILFVALVLSTIAAYYSILGLVTIFSAAAIPIIVMATAMETAKVSVTVWLHRYWSQVKWGMRLYLVPAVGILMLITSMGIFGLLSRAHEGQAAENGDIAAKVAVYDEKIKTEKESIETARQALAQMNAAIDQTLARSTSEGGASRAVQVRKSQTKERQSLLNEIDKSQAAIAKLQDERAPIAVQLRHAVAEVGPIRYVAAMIYSDNPDATMLERAVRWVIILLVSVFDPLAIFMVLAANESMTWERKQKLAYTVPEITEDSNFSDIIAHHIAEDNQHYEEFEDRIEHMEERVELVVDILTDDVERIKAQRVQGIPIQIEDEPEFEPEPEIIEPEVIELDPEIIEPEPADHQAKELKKLETIWEQMHPGFTTEEHRELFALGLIDYLPWTQPGFAGPALRGEYDHLLEK